MAYEVRPYTNYHELNMDWVLEEMHKAVAAWKESEKYWTNAETAFNEMQAAFDENTGYYKVQWPQFQNQIHMQMDAYEGRINNIMDDFKSEMQSKQEAFEAEVSANYAEFTTDTIDEYQKFMTAQQNAYNAFVSTINEQWDTYKETMNTAFHDLTVEEAEARAKLEADVHEYVQNWFDSLNVQESVNEQLQAYLQSDEAKAYIATIITDEVLAPINEAINTLQGRGNYLFYAPSYAITPKILETEENMTYSNKILNSVKFLNPEKTVYGGAWLESHQPVNATIYTVGNSKENAIANFLYYLGQHDTLNCAPIIIHRFLIAMGAEVNNYENTVLGSFLLNKFEVYETTTLNLSSATVRNLISNSEQVRMEGTTTLAVGEKSIRKIIIMLDGDEKLNISSFNVGYFKTILHLNISGKTLTPTNLIHSRNNIELLFDNLIGVRVSAEGTQWTLTIG